MPLLNISIRKTRTQKYIDKLSKTIHQVLVDTWDIPHNDYFHIIHKMDKHCFLIDKTMHNMQRSDDVVVIQITSMPRTTQMKLDFYTKLTDVLKKELELNPDDVFISIVSNNPEDWSFGKGKAQLLTPSPTERP